MDGWLVGRAAYKAAGDVFARHLLLLWFFFDPIVSLLFLPFFYLGGEGVFLFV